MAAPFPAPPAGDNSQVRCSCLPLLGLLEALAPMLPPSCFWSKSRLFKQGPGPSLSPALDMWHKHLPLLQGLEVLCPTTLGLVGSGLLFLRVPHKPATWYLSQSFSCMDQASAPSSSLAQGSGSSWLSHHFGEILQMLPCHGRVQRTCGPASLAAGGPPRLPLTQAYSCPSCLSPNQAPVWTERLGGNSALSTAGLY